MGRQLFRFRVSDHAATVVRTLHPQIKRKLKAAFTAIAADPFSGKSLVDELSGLRSYRVGRFRVIYRIDKDRIIDIVTVGPRERIYEETYRLIQKE